jgi:hypothetical protein
MKMTAKKIKMILTDSVKNLHQKLNVEMNKFLKLRDN